MTKCQEKKPAENTSDNSRRKARQKCQGKKTFDYVLHDKQPESETGNDQLKQKWPTLLTLSNPTSQSHIYMELDFRKMLSRSSDKGFCWNLLKFGAGGGLV